MTRVGVRRRVHEISRRPPRLVRAFLAETYDGIGQVVKVQMSRGAVTNALNARIAAGDFGGQRVFPEGTPVHVFVNRGQLEVFLGNIPKSCLFDPFDRTLPPAVNQGWGTGPAGTWQLTGGSGVNPQSGVDGNRAFTEVRATGSGQRQYCWLIPSSGSYAGTPLSWEGIFTLGIPADSQTTQLEVDIENNDLTGNIVPAIYMVLGGSTNLAGSFVFFRLDFYSYDVNLNYIQNLTMPAPLSWVAGNPIHVKGNVENDHYDIRIWLEGTESEPESPTISMPLSPTWDSFFPNGPQLGVGLTSPRAQRTYMDSFQICLA